MLNNIHQKVFAMFLDIADSMTKNYKSKNAPKSLLGGNPGPKALWIK